MVAAKPPIVPHEKRTAQSVIAHCEFQVSKHWGAAWRDELASVSIPFPAKGKLGKHAAEDTRFIANRFAIDVFARAMRVILTTLPRNSGRSRPPETSDSNKSASRRAVQAADLAEAKKILLEAAEDEDKEKEDEEEEEENEDEEGEVQEDQEEEDSRDEESESEEGSDSGGGENDERNEEEEEQRTAKRQKTNHSPDRDDHDDPDSTDVFPTPELPRQGLAGDTSIASVEYDDETDLQFHNSGLSNSTPQRALSDSAVQASTGKRRRRLTQAQFTHSPSPSAMVANNRNARGGRGAIGGAGGTGRTGGRGGARSVSNVADLGRGTRPSTRHQTPVTPTPDSAEHDDGVSSGDDVVEIAKLKASLQYFTRRRHKLATRASLAEASIKSAEDQLADKKNPSNIPLFVQPEHAATLPLQERKDAYGKALSAYMGLLDQYSVEVKKSEEEIVQASQAAETAKSRLEGWEDTVRENLEEDVAQFWGMMTGYEDGRESGGEDEDEDEV